MTKIIGRRSFLKQGCCIGGSSIIGIGVISDLLYSNTVENHNWETGDIKTICKVNKEIYVPSPEPGVGTNVNMTYIGQGLRREELRSLARSSDWIDTVRRRTSEDNGRN